MKTKFSHQISIILLSFGLAFSQLLSAQTCPDPTQLKVADLFNTSTTLNWQGTSSSYKVWVGTQGFYQGSQTVGGTQHNISTSTFNATGLSSNTCYEYVVKSYCSTTDSSNWAGPYLFCPPKCTPFTTPYTQNFDSTNASDFDSCWSVLNTIPSSSMGTNTFRNVSAPNSFRMINSNPGSLLLISPAFSDFDNQKRIIFNVYDYSSRVDLIIGTMSNPADSTSFTPYRTITEAEMPDDTWQEFRVVFDTYTGTDKYVAFKHGQNASSSRLYIDDFLYDAPTCLDPSGLNFNGSSLTSVDLSWQTGGATSWDVAYGQVGFTPGSSVGTQITTNINTNYILPLSQGAIQEVYVRDNCGAGDVGLWVGPLTVYTSTACTPLSGNYTIGTTGTYTTFSDAANALSVCGISGPVIFNVQSGYYSDKLHLSGIPGFRKGVPGVSATNTITFNGSGNDTLEWNETGIQAAVWIDSVNYVTLNNLYIINDVQAEGWGILITDVSEYINITNNTIFMDTSGVSHSDKAPINISGNPLDDLTTGASANHLNITGNTLYGGYYSAVIYGGGSSRTDFSHNLVFNNNEVRNFYNRGLYINYYDTIEVNNNTIISLNSTTNEDGAYVQNSDNYHVKSNFIHVKDYALYINDGNDVATVTQNSTIINNMVISDDDYGLYLNDLENTSVFHNSIVGEPALRINDQVNVNIQNNIFASADDYAFESDDNFTVNDTIDFNLYYVSGSGDLFDIGSSSKLASLAAWQTADATKNINSVQGNPLFVSATDLHVTGNLTNDVGNNAVGVLADIDGDTRPASGSSTVDIGADEYSILVDDFTLHSGAFQKNGLCYSTTDTIVLTVENIIGLTADFSLTPITAHYDVTGPINTSGTITVNTGILNANDTLEMRASTIDLSIPGVYTLNAYINPNADNGINSNDTLALNSVTIVIDTLFRVIPKALVTLEGGDTATLNAISPAFFGALFISEVTQLSSAGTIGEPVGGKPTYIVADDYIEVTGLPGASLAGYTLEQWGDLGLTSTHTFKRGDVLSPNGTAIVAVGTLGASVEDPANFYYHGNGNYTGVWGSGRGCGRIIKDPNGNIIDAVVYDYASFPFYIWPVGTGVTVADWSGVSPYGGSSFGIRLMGPDVNSATGWVLSSIDTTQNPNTLNAGIVVPTLPVSGFNWSVNGTPVGINTSLNLYGDSLSAGTYNYVATYTSPCGTFIDTVVVIRLACTAPLLPTVSSVGCDTATLDLGTRADSLLVQYGAKGFTLGSGNYAGVSAGSSTYTIQGLTSGTAYDIYLATVCTNGDTSAFVGPIITNTTVNNASFTYTVNGFTVNFDASASSGTSPITYSWDYGDGNTGTGVTPNHLYSTGGARTITLTISDACGFDDTTLTIADVDLVENRLNNSLKLYPNPTTNNLQVFFEADSKWAALRVYNAIGKEIQVATVIEHNGVFNKTLDFSDLPNGMYSIIIETEKNVTTRKVIKYSK